MADSDHEFGGVSTDLKLSLVEGYLRAFTTALRNKFQKLWYIDAFAGTGERTVRHSAQDANLFESFTEERIARHRGSARIAIEVEPRFDRLIFMDENHRHCEALRSLGSNHPGRHIDVLEGNANDQVKQLLDGQRWSSTRAVMFIDPYGMSVDWKTLEVIRETSAIDVWYLVSLPASFVKRLDVARL